MSTASQSSSTASAPGPISSPKFVRGPESSHPPGYRQSPPVMGAPRSAFRGVESGSWVVAATSRFAVVLSTTHDLGCRAHPAGSQSTQDSIRTALAGVCRIGRARRALADYLGYHRRVHVRSRPNHLSEVDHEPLPPHCDPVHRFPVHHAADGPRSGRAGRCSRHCVGHRLRRFRAPVELAEAPSSRKQHRASFRCVSLSGGLGRSTNDLMESVAWLDQRRALVATCALARVEPTIAAQ